MTDTREITTAEHRAVGLYAILDRDICDFIDMAYEEPVETLSLLHEMLTTQSRKHDSHTEELNSYGSRLVATVMQRRGMQPAKNACRSCGGTGYADVKRGVRCNVCNGTGRSL